MTGGLYDAAFAALGRIYGDAARRSITGITLIAGFASTVGWPLSAWGLETIGWRNTCFAWAAAHILIGLPINLLMLPAVKGAKAAVANAVKPHIPIDRTMILLAFVFAAAWTVTGAMAAHLPRIMEAAGATTAQAVFAGALIGPAQVAARIFEAGFLSRFHPLVSTKLACVTNPIGAAILGLAGGGAASVFAIFYGAGNGILTIARGTLPLAIFGPQNYGYRLGIIGAPARMAQAAAPLLFSLLIDIMGSRVLIVSSALSLAALFALFLLRSHPPVTEAITRNSPMVDDTTPSIVASIHPNTAPRPAIRRSLTSAPAAWFSSRAGPRSTATAMWSARTICRASRSGVREPHHRAAAADAEMTTTAIHCAMPNWLYGLPRRFPCNCAATRISAAAPVPMPTVRKPSALDRWMNGRDQTL